MDLASVLAVVALNLRPGDRVLDTCSGPGGKALATLQTMLPSRLVCNDIKGPRLKRVKSVVNMYLGEFAEAKTRIEFIKEDARELPYIYGGAFDKVGSDSLSEKLISL